MQSVALFKRKNILLIIGIALIVMLMCMFISNGVAEASLKSQIISNDAKQLEEMADKAGAGIIGTAREIAFVFLLLFLLSMGYSLWVSRSAEGLADMKVRTGVVIVSIVLVFFGDKILGAIFSWFGYSGT